MTRTGASLAMAAALLLGAVPAFAAANKEQQLLMAEVRMLQQHQQQLQQLVLALTDTLTLVTNKLDEQSGASRKALADQRLLIEGMTDNVRVLRERANDTNVRLMSISQELEAIRQTIAAQPAPTFAQIPSTEPSGDPGTAATPPGPGAAAGAPAPPPPNVSIQRTYEAAYSDFAAGQYDLAIVGFETFLKFFPRHMDADDAQLNIGNSYYNMGKFREAIAAYQRVISDYPGTESVPSAHYKMGLSYNALKQPDLARKALETVLQNHPGAPEATLSRQALQRMEGK